MYNFPIELIEIIFSQVPIKTCRLMNQMLKNVTNKRFIDSMYVNKNDKLAYIAEGHPLFTYDYVAYRWQFINNGKLVCTNDIFSNNTLNNIDMQSVYNILKNRNYPLPKNFAKNKIMNMLNNTILLLYMNNNNFYQRQDIDLYYCWLVTNAINFGLMDLNCLETIKDKILHISTTKNKELFNLIKQHILTMD